MTTETLLETALREILGTSPALAALEPRPRIGDDHDKMPPVSLVVACEYTGRSIQILDDYDVAITLTRPFRDEGTDTADFKTLWAEVRARIDAWYSLLPAIASVGSIAHLTIDEIEQSGTTFISGSEISRTLTLSAFIRAAG